MKTPIEKAASEIMRALAVSPAAEDVKTQIIEIITKHLDPAAVPPPPSLEQVLRSLNVAWTITNGGGETVSGRGQLWDVHARSFESG